jgi:2-(3-amino-3-carboxypropyl)histidine synthase
MEVFFIKAKRKLKAPKEIYTDTLPKKIALVASIQYIPILDDIKKLLEVKGIDVKIPKLSSDISGQILGCDNYESDRAVLCISDGNFHPAAVKTEVYRMDYGGNVQKLQKTPDRQKIAYMKFLSSEKIGVLISTKPGQNQIKITENKKLEKKYPDKKFYYFIANQIGDMTDFNFIDCFINTACPRLADDSFSKPILNIGYLG